MTTNKVRRVLGFGPRSSQNSWSSRGCQRATRAISSLSDVNGWTNRSDRRQHNLRGLEHLVLVRCEKSAPGNESVIDETTMKSTSSHPEKLERVLESCAVTSSSHLLIAQTPGVTPTFSRHHVLVRINEKGVARDNRAHSSTVPEQTLDA
jgi:hypothetical protein